MKILLLFFILCCNLFINSTFAQNNESINYLALGDSYTKGEGVCDTCAFPSLLKAALEKRFKKKVALRSIAETGWTTSDLKNTLKHTDIGTNNDLVTLLIGVNNQYQDIAFSKFKKEFPLLIEQAITAAQGDPKKVIVLSIPDYAYTPSTYGADNQKKVTEEINQYNEYILFIAEKKGAYYFNITDLTRMGIADPSLVAEDGLHPSAQAHQKFTDEIYPTVLRILNF